MTGQQFIGVTFYQLGQVSDLNAGSLHDGVSLVLGIVPLIEFYTSPGICTELMHAFIATDLSPVGQRLEPGERIVVETLATDEVRRRFVAGEFKDGKTIAVLGTYFARLTLSSGATER